MSSLSSSGSSILEQGVGIAGPESRCTQGRLLALYDLDESYTGFTKLEAQSAIVNYEAKHVSWPILSYECL